MNKFQVGDWVTFAVHSSAAWRIQSPLKVIIAARKALGVRS